MTKGENDSYIDERGIDILKPYQIRCKKCKKIIETNCMSFESWCSCKKSNKLTKTK